MTNAIRITSDHGQILGLKWWNSQTQVDITASAWDSPCKSFTISKAFRQQNASYWGGFQVGEAAEVKYKGLELFFALCVKPCMKVFGAAWLLIGSQVAIKVERGAELVLGGVQIRSLAGSNPHHHGDQP